MYQVNTLPAANKSAYITGCCADFDPAKWDEQTLNFSDKLFVEFSTRNIRHTPINMGRKYRKILRHIEENDAATDEYLVMTDNISPWRSDHYIAVNKPVPGMNTVKLSGTFITKVFEGSFRNEHKWRDKLLEFVKKSGYQPLKTYFFYTTCPACAKNNGKNYVVGIEQVSAINNEGFT